MRVEGHTDNDPLVKTKATWTDGEISRSRGLWRSPAISSESIDPKLIETAGFGEYHRRRAGRRTVASRLLL